MAAGAEPPEHREAVDRALELAWRALSTRERTVAELRAFLERRGVGSAAVDAAVRELCAAGYLDDAAYARRFAEDRRALARWGSQRIARDLGRRGVAEGVIDAALGEADGGERERAAALALLHERFPEPPREDRGRDRAWRMLVRRGYAPELAYEAVRAHDRAHRAGEPGSVPAVARRLARD